VGKYKRLALAALLGLIVCAADYGGRDISEAKGYGPMSQPGKVYYALLWGVAASVLLWSLTRRDK